MRITLSVISIKGQPPFSSMSYTFEQEGGTVGRDQRADWVLLDDKKYLSGTHFKIHCDGKSFSVMDLSTNGTYINDTILPLGIDNSHVLNKGDQIKIGEYIVIASSIEHSSSTLSLPLRDELGSLKSIETNNSDDPFFSSQGYFSDSGVSKAKKKKSDFGEKSSFIDTESSNRSKGRLKDPFFSEGEDYIIQEGDSFGPDFDDEPVARGSFSVDINTPLRTNSVISNTPQSLIETHDSSGIGDDNLVDTNDVFDFLDKSNINIKQQLSQEKNIELESTPSLITKNAPIQESVKETDTVDNISNRNAVEAFLKGAGLNKNSLSNEIPVELFETIGETFSGVLQGTIDLLRSRSEIKNHLHLDRTIINSVENNPLKFMPNAQQVILQLLNKELNDNTYLPLVLALEEAFDDINAHQVAMTTATEKALRAVIKEHFSPKNLADNISKTNPISAVIPIQRQAKLWNMFEALYENIEVSATESFQRLLDYELSNAYEEQLLEIKSLRTHKNGSSK